MNGDYRMVGPQAVTEGCKRTCSNCGGCLKQTVTGFWRCDSCIFDPKAIKYFHCSYCQKDRKTTEKSNTPNMCIGCYGRPERERAERERAKLKLFIVFVAAIGCYYYNKC